MPVLYVQLHVKHRLLYTGKHWLIPTPQVQVAAINMLNMAISQPDLTMRAKAALSEERSLVPSLMALLDHSLPILRSKGVVAILLLCR